MAKILKTFALIAVAASIGASGCQFKMGQSNAVVRLTSRIPDVVVESGSGEFIHHAGYESEQRNVLLFMRGTW